MSPERVSLRSRGERARHARIRRRESLREAALRFGVGIVELSHYEHGRADAETAARIEAAFLKGALLP